MTAVDTTWAPDHAPLSEVHTSPAHSGEQVHSPPVHRTPTRPVPVERRALGLYSNIVGKFADVEDPVARYELYIYWRSVLERAAQEMTVQAGYALIDLRDSGLSQRKIAELVTEAGCPLSASGVDQAIKRSRGAR